MSAIDLQRIMEMRENARVRQQEKPVGRKSGASSSSDWKALLESKRQELGVSSGRSASAAQTTTKSSNVATNIGLAKNTGSAESMEEKVDELRDRKSMGLAVRELGNFIDVRA